MEIGQAAMESAVKHCNLLLENGRIDQTNFDAHVQVFAQAIVDDEHMPLAKGSRVGLLYTRLCGNGGAPAEPLTDDESRKLLVMTPLGRKALANQAPQI